MIWVFVIAAVVLLAGAIWWAFEEAATAGREASRTALVTLASTFLGVGLAILATSNHEHTETLRRLCAIASVVISEMEQGTQLSAQDAASAEVRDGDDVRMVLSNPATALAVLLADSAFLQEADPAAVRELLTISTKLQWHPLPPISGVLGSVPRAPNLERVQEKLARGLELVRAQRSRLCSE